MRLIVIEYVSVDGVIQAPGHAQEDTADGIEHADLGAVAADHGDR
jgi:hypothetical protein